MGPLVERVSGWRDAFGVNPKLSQAFCKGECRAQHIRGGKMRVRREPDEACPLRDGWVHENRGQHTPPGNSLPQYDKIENR